jgi:hypothetical protein
MPDDPNWRCGWEDARKRGLTAGFDATPAQRLAWLEEMLVLAYRSGALPRRKSDGSSVEKRDRKAHGS